MGNVITTSSRTNPFQCPQADIDAVTWICEKYTVSGKKETTVFSA